MQQSWSCSVRRGTRQLLRHYGFANSLNKIPQALSDICKYTFSGFWQQLTSPPIRNVGSKWLGEKPWAVAMFHIKYVYNVTGTKILGTNYSYFYRNAKRMLPDITTKSKQVWRWESCAVATTVTWSQLNQSEPVLRAASRQSAKLPSHAVATCGVEPPTVKRNHNWNKHDDNNISCWQVNQLAENLCNKTAW
jgi:hypothetical protein